MFDKLTDVRNNCVNNYAELLKNGRQTQFFLNFRKGVKL